MRFADVDGLVRAAGELDTLAQLADQQRRSITGASTALVGQDWDGTAAQQFQWQSLAIDSELAAAASAASRTAIVLRRLAEDLAIAEEMAQDASRLELMANGTAPVAAPDTARSTIAAPSPEAMKQYATTGLQTAIEHAERAWRSARAGLQEIWSPQAELLQTIDGASKLGGLAMSPAAAAARRVQVTEYWGDVGKGARDRLRSGLADQARDDTKAVRDLARSRQQANLRQAQQSYAWASHGHYGRAGKVFDTTVAKRLGGSGALRGARGIPVVGLLASGATTAADIEEGVDPTRAVTANAASLLAATAAVAVLSGPAMPFVATVAVVAVVGYGVGNAVHGLIAHGDVLHDFKSDIEAAKDAGQWVGDKAGDAAGAVGRFFKGLSP